MTTYKKTKEQGCCSVNFLKYVLFIFNFVFLMAGCIVLGVGIWTVVDKHEFVSLLSSGTYVSVAYLLISAGVICLIVSIIGCIGVWREDRCALLIYTFMLLLIFLIEAVAGVIAYVYVDQVGTELRANLNETFIMNYKNDPAKTDAIDWLQRKYKCCGAISFQDWKYSLWLKNDKRTNNTVPDSCCKTESVNCGVRNVPSNVYYDGCARAIETYIKDHLIVIGAVGLGICVVQVFGMVLSCCLYVKLKDYEDAY